MLNKDAGNLLASDKHHILFQYVCEYLHKTDTRGQNWHIRYFLIHSVLAFTAAVVLMASIGAAIGATGHMSGDLNAEGLSNQSNGLADSGGHFDRTVHSSITVKNRVTKVDADQKSDSSDVALLVQFHRQQSSLRSLKSRSAKINRLQTRAAVQQKPLRRYAADRPGVTVEQSFWLGNIAVLRVDTSDIAVESKQAVMQQVSQIPSVKSVSENKRVHLNATTAMEDADRFSAGRMEEQLLQPNSFESATAGTTYGVEQINAHEVWEIYGTQGEGTSIAVLDTGVDPSHPDIELSKWQEWDTSGNPINTTPKDHGAHGTHVSGTATGGTASGTHIGVAPGAELYHGAVLNSCDQSGCSGSMAKIIAGMQWAVEEGADVISMSLGVPGKNDAFVEPVIDAAMLGVPVVAAIGNGGDGTSAAPGNTYTAIGVGASNFDGEIASFSGGEATSFYSHPAWPQQWISPTVAAPGVAIKSSIPGGSYQQWPGTSMATPHVAGTVALMQSATERQVSVQNIREALTETAYGPPESPFDFDTRYGYGIVDAMAAVKSVYLDNVTISGTVTDPAGVPLVAANVTLFRFGLGWSVTEVANTTTNSAGKYSFTTAPDKYFMEGDKSGYRYNLSTLRPFTPEGKNQVNMVLEVANGSLSGIVTDEGGTPVEGAEVVFVENSSGTEIDSFVTGENGTYNVKLKPGSYEISVEKTNYTSFAETITVEPESETTLNVTLTPLSGVLTGTVTDKEGNPLSSVEILVFKSKSNSTEPVASLLTDEDGIYEGELKTGTYKIIVEKARYTAFEDTVTIETNSKTTLNVTLTPLSGVVTGNITNKAGDLLTDIELVFDHENSTEVVSVVTDENGTYDAELPVGGYEVVVNELGFAPYEKQVSVEADTETVLDILLESLDNGTVTGAVTDSEGAKLDNVTITAIFDGSPVETTNTNHTGVFQLTLPPAAYTIKAVKQGLQRSLQLVSVSENGTREQDFELADPPPALPGFDHPPGDLTGDGLFEDIDGDGEFNIFDVQALFEGVKSDTVQNNSPAFNFDDNNIGTVDIFDVQALFESLE